MNTSLSGKTRVENLPQSSTWQKFGAPALGAILLAGLLAMLLVISVATAQAALITFPNSGNSFTENSHNFTVSGDGYVWNNDFRSAGYCAVNNVSFGTTSVAKTSGNPIQVNSLWLKGSWGGFSVTVKGWDGGTERYSTGASLDSTYSQVNLSSWTGINKITVTANSNGFFALDDIDYTVENVAPTDIALSSNSLASGDPSGTTVGSFSSTDPEDGGGHTYTFAASGADNASFTISGTSLQTAFVANHETKSSYSVKIRSTDSGGLFLEETFSITVVAPGTVWSGPKMTFTKAGGANWTLEENQDRITDNVWLTRADWDGLFNIKTETGFDWDTCDSPKDTEWAYGSAADYASLTFEPFADWHGWCAGCAVGENAVLHLISENIYMDIKILSWDCDGSVSYERSTGPAEVDTDEDGTPDSSDNCPNDPDKVEPGDCGCGVADTDTDEDGVADCNDNCPTTPNPGQEDDDLNGVGNACDVPPVAPAPTGDSDWTGMTSDTIDDFTGVWLTKGPEAFACAAGGRVQHYESGAWSQMTSNTTDDLAAIWASGASDVFTVGAGGRVQHFNGTAWSQMTSNTTDDLMSVWGSGATDVFATGAGGRIQHYDGAWSQMTSNTTADLNGVWGAAADDVFAVGAGGAILHYNGTAWSSMASYTTSTLRAVFGTSGTDVWAVGDGGAIGHYDGASWTKQASGMTSARFGGVYCLGQEVFVVGEAGWILRYDGTAWSSMISGTTEDLAALWGSSEPRQNDYSITDTTVYAVGTAGTVLEFLLSGSSCFIQTLLR